MSNSLSRLWRLLSRGRGLVLIAGPCVIENESLCLKVARYLKRVSADLGLVYVFKASYDKANRTAAKSFRGPGIERGLEILERVRGQIDVPVLTDVHTPEEAIRAATVADVLQIPAMLCRQTDLVVAAARTGRIVNLKKGQFLSPAEMGQVARKAAEAGGKHLILTERGTTFGYNNLVADMRSIPILKSFGYPVVFDATHSVQLPGGGGDCSAGEGAYAPILARAAVAAGADGVFVETHPEPQRALSDGPNMVPLREMKRLMQTLMRLKQALK